jgi:hypothetical protein
MHCVGEHVTGMHCIGAHVAGSQVTGMQEGPWACARRSWIVATMAGAA